MSAWFRDGVTGIWLLLLAITAGSWAISMQGATSVNAWAAPGILVLSFLKVRLVIRYFMDVRGAPAALKWACDVWIVALMLSLLWFYR